ncbi:hypothetical protein TNCT_540621 [Trichonephila clavata]|uniref:CRAL/TRIO N-terminal domain-containing protein n=1 Tax=Trichonephila clavata TaxID=2740835 RepID=A0A8X6G4H9_TRICU|nr:hypothetical protein TNCT_540621 [Trichonephila clavata]
MPVSRKVPSFQDLTAYEKSVVDELRRRTFHDLTPIMQKDETIFYRFCKARDYDLEEAEIMLRKHITWAKEMKMDTFLTSYKPPEIGRQSQAPGMTWRLDFKKWSVRNANRPVADARKKEEQEKFLHQMGLLMDTPKPG